MNGFQKSNPSAYFNFLHAKYEEWTARVDVKSYPYSLCFDPSSVCNLRCPLCPTGIESEARRSGTRLGIRDRALLQRDLFSSVIDELGDSLFFVMFYNWGEPLLNKDLPAYIRCAKEREIETEVHTNLSLRLTDGYMEELLSSGLDTLGVSIDGFTQEVYEKYRRGGNLELVKANLKHLVKTRGRLGVNTRIAWNLLLFRFNETELVDMQQFCEDLGIEFVVRQAFIVDPEWVPSSVDLFAESLAAWVNGPVARAKKWWKKRRVACGWHYGCSVINADGTVSPCCASQFQKDDFGKVLHRRGAFRQIWNSEPFRISRAYVSDSEKASGDANGTICKDCSFGLSLQLFHERFDDDVVAGFWEHFRGRDPLMEKAFRLLRRRKAFVRFFERNLAPPMYRVAG